MTPRRMMAWSVVVTLAILAAAWCTLPAPRTLPETAVYTPTIRVVTVTASSTTFVFAPATVTLTPTPVPVLVIDSLPMVTVTPAPTRTPEPPHTPVPTGTRGHAVQRG